MSNEEIAVYETGNDSNHRAKVLAGVAGGSALLFGAVTIASASRASARIDRVLAPRLAARPRGVVRRASAAIAPAGKWFVFVPLGVAVGAYVVAARNPHWTRGPRIAGAGAVVASGVLAAALERLFDSILPQPPVPPGRNSTREKVFPSGHAFVASAVTLTSAYVLSREDLADTRAAFALATLVPMVSGGARLATEKHWPSDVVAGLLGGVTVAASCAAAYEHWSRRIGTAIIITDDGVRDL